MIVLYGFIVCSFTYIGFGLSQYYIHREKLFYQLSRLCEKLKTDIGFLHMPLSDILTLAQSEYNTLKGIIEICLNILESGNPIIAQKLFDIYISRYVNEEEKKLICAFFSDLGKSDEHTQIEKIENYGGLFGAVQNGCAAERKRFSPMFKKLGFLCGVTVCLFML